MDFRSSIISSLKCIQRHHLPLSYLATFPPNKVSKEINLGWLHVADYPVGLESATFRVTNLLDVGSDDGAHMVGIYGMGGIGILTLARAVYNSLIADNFDVTYASGLPLALEVIGSNLVRKCIQNWEDAIDQYERIPPDEIQDILKVSFGALNNEVKSIFLEIACCFKEYEMTDVEHVLSAHYGYNIKPHLEVLVEKSLLKLGGDCYTMHDLIEEMGKNIFNQESLDEPEERSRLWSEKDIIEVLEENKVKETYQVCIEQMVEWNGKAFKKMEKLETLIIKNASFYKSPKCLPNSLRVLEWKGYP
ncbi:hypothetical protein Fmac_005556 [Flemingia macrophylla]|uniref:Disease resistance protein Roq1-like winged-helix domain-containing protein n=1 Tax=Flemingia macrophylla TaxID=520843 RepID=A0ABD1N843_9FABA